MKTQKFLHIVNHNECVGEIVKVEALWTLRFLI